MALAVAIVALHVIGLALLLALVVPHAVKVGTGGFGLGLGATAYVLGLRHAFDADRIAAIDNTTRKLMADGQRPLSVGFFFSLGHSTVVFGLALLLGLGVRGLGGAVGHDHSTLHAATGVIGPAVSGAFLFLIGLLNVGVLIGSVRVFGRMRAGQFDEHELDYSITITGLSVAVALLIGTIELGSVLVDPPGPGPGPLGDPHRRRSQLRRIPRRRDLCPGLGDRRCHWRLGRLDDRWTLSVANGGDDRAIAAPEAELR